MFTDMCFPKIPPTIDLTGASRYFFSLPILAPRVTIPISPFLVSEIYHGERSQRMFLAVALKRRAVLIIGNGWEIHESEMEVFLAGKRGICKLGKPPASHIWIPEAGGYSWKRNCFIFRFCWEKLIAILVKWVSNHISRYPPIQPADIIRIF